MKVCVPLFQPEVHGERGWVAGFYYVRNCLHALAHLSSDRIPEVVAFVPEGLSEPLLFPEYRGRTPWLTEVPIPRSMVAAGGEDLRALVDGHACDVVFPLAGIPRVAFSAPAVGWLPDFQHRRLPKLFSAEEYAFREAFFSFVVAWCDAIVCSSQTVKDDLSTFFPTLAEKGRVVRFSVPLPEALFESQPAATVARFGIHRRYVYLPNQFWVHKNHRMVFDAWRRLKQRGDDTLLVCSGTTEDYRFSGYHEELAAFVSQHGLSDTVRIVGFVDRQDQLQLYRGATLVLQPSLFEGWSTTIEEAKALGKPLVVSDIPVHREQCGQAATYIDPGDAAGLAHTIASLVPTLPLGHDRDGEDRARAEAQRRTQEFGELLIDVLTPAASGRSRAGTMSVDNRRMVLPLVVELQQRLRTLEEHRVARVNDLGRLQQELDAAYATSRRLDDANAGLRAELATLSADHAARYDVIERLKDMHAALAADHVARGEVIERLKDMHAALAADHVARGEVIERLKDMHAALAADHVARGEVIERLSAQVRAAEDDRLTVSAQMATLATDHAARGEVIERLSSQLAAAQADVDARTALVGEQAAQLAEYRSFGWGVVGLGIYARNAIKRRWNRSRSRSKAPVESVPRSSFPRPPRRAGQVLHVGLDVMQIQFGVSGGVEVYMRTLVQALRAVSPEVQLTLLCTSDQEPHLRTYVGDRIRLRSMDAQLDLLVAAAAARRRLSGARMVRSGYANFSFARLSEDSGIDILHSPVQIFSQMDFDVPAVLNLHDLQHLHYPENFTLEDLQARLRLYGRSASLASAIIASSEFVRRDIIERMGVPAFRVHVIPVACNPEVERGLSVFPPERARSTYDLPDTYGIYPAQFWPHKNHARLIEALAIARGRAPRANLALVLTGNRSLPGWAEASAALDRHGMRDHVRLLDYVPTEHLGGLYRAATFCVVPSLFEASSYPVIEAQMLGCPAMCSNVTSLPELMVDGAGLLFDPRSPADIAEKMLQFLESDQLRAQCAENGRKRAHREHSVETHGTRVAALYEQVLASSGRA